MAFELSLKFNNQAVESYISVIRISNDHPILSWESDIYDKVTINSDTGIITDVEESSQGAYKIKIATTNFAIGTNLFVGDVIQTGLVESQSLFWKYVGPQIERGVIYYGQIYIIDEFGQESDIKTFSFLYNSLPYVDNISITPALPAVTDNLQLNYDYHDDDGDLETGTIIRWFKNGTYQRQFDNATIINSSFLQNNDIWNVDIYPSDGYEYGSRVTSSQTIILPVAVVLSSLTILPQNPNTDDILKADYLISDGIETNNVFIRWYINNNIVTEFNDQKTIKPSVQVGDTVRFEIKHERASIYTSSLTVSIVSSDFIVSNIIVDGIIEPLDVSSITPNVKWNVFVPDGKSINYTSIKIGTFYEANNIYSTTLAGNIKSFTIPQNLLEKGRDYYISIASSDTQTFVKYTSTHFRVEGSRWEKTASNSTGWTFETLFKSSGGGVTDYQFIRVNDGSRFAEIRIYLNKIRLMSGSFLEYNVDTTVSRFLTVAGQGDDIKIYLDRELIINGEGIFTQISNIKRLEVGDSLNSGFNVFYKYFSYTTSGYFLPGISSEYTDLQFHSYMEFENNEIISLTDYQDGKYLFGLNPDNSNESGTIYAIKSGSVKKIPTVARTFTPINRISKSPDGKVIVCAHAQGVTVISGYLIDNYNNEMIFTDSSLTDQYLKDNEWEVVETSNSDVSYFDSDGFNINTLG